MRKEWLETDYYGVLGVAKDASERDIKKAYRALAQELHPDKNPGDEAAETRFKQVNEAYEVLGNAETRKEYDSLREVGYYVGGPGGGTQYVRIEDLLGGGDTRSPFDMFGGLSDLFGGGRRARQAQPGRDLRTEVGLTFYEAIGGVTKQITVEGQTFKVKIPKGVEDGARIRLRGKGEPSYAGGSPGDLYVTVFVGKHPLYERAGSDLKITVPITFVEAALGAEIDVPTLDGKVRVRIPPGTGSGKVFRVSGRGIERSDGTKGDVLVTVTVQIPTELTDEQRALLEKFNDNGPDDNPRAYLGV
jgi:molecular chaperone DnaJ